MLTGMRRWLRPALAGSLVIGGAAGIVGLSGPAFAMGTCGNSGPPSTSGGTDTCTYNASGAIDTFTVPPGVTSVTITALGAGGGSAGDGTAGGAGAGETGTFAVTPGATLDVIAGQAGFHGYPENDFLPGGPGGGGGGGGSFVYNAPNPSFPTFPLIAAAAGGGGGLGGGGGSGISASTQNVGTDGGAGTGGGAGGTGGTGGVGTSCNDHSGGGGGGFNGDGGNGGNGTAGTAVAGGGFGGVGGELSGDGGFGGGGGGGNSGGGGGGGYSGGSGGGQCGTFGGGGGGGSYNAGTGISTPDPSQVFGGQYGGPGENGLVTITFVSLSLSPPSSAAQVGVSYTSALAASGGVSPYTFSITSGALPPRLTLNTSTGAVTGTPTTPGTFNFSAQVVDSGAIQRALRAASRLPVASGRRCTR